MHASLLQLNGSGAYVSEDGRYRYLLWRTWGGDLLSENLEVTPTVFVMLNPSTATATEDDPTIRRCVGFARREARGPGVLIVANLFAYRATDPGDLVDAARRGENVVGPENDAWLRCLANAQYPTIFGWGNLRATFRGRAEEVRCMLWKDPLCLGVCRSGDPKHPLYLPQDTPIEQWRS